MRSHVGTLAELKAHGRLIARVGEFEVVVLEGSAGPVAYENRCPHLGGPVGGGRVVPRIVAVIDDRGAVIGERFAHDERRISCPWHGFEFDLETGICPVDARYRLRKFSIEEADGEIYVVP